MLIERTPVRALARSRAVVSMPWKSSSRAIQTSCTAFSTQSHRTQLTKPHIAANKSTHLTVRHASSTTRNPSTPPLTADAAASSLTWNQFLQLRKVRRRYNLVASMLTGVSTSFAGVGYLSTMDLNSLGQLMFGIDPMIALGASTMAAGALGWLIGPFAGNAVFNLMHRGVKNDVMVKEKDFFHRIQRYRAEIAAGGNLQNNPFPDYYGEKIYSVHGYRNWLRDQRKFSQKRELRGPWIKRNQGASKKTLG